jgi:hypothetical protein
MIEKSHLEVDIMNDLSFAAWPLLTLRQVMPKSNMLKNKHAINLESLDNALLVATTSVHIRISVPKRSPVVRRSMVRRSMVRRPTFRKSMVRRPMVRRPTVRKSMVRRPTVRKSMVRRPTVKKSMVRRPTVRKSMVRRPMARRPVARRPMARRPVARKPVARKQVKIPLVRAQALMSPKRMILMIQSMSVRTVGWALWISQTSLAIRTSTAGSVLLIAVSIRILKFTPILSVNIRKTILESSSMNAQSVGSLLFIAHSFLSIRESMSKTSCIP